MNMLSMYPRGQMSHLGLPASALTVAAAVVIVCLLATGALGGLIADGVLGQSNLTHSGVNRAKANSMYGPTVFAIDAKNHLYVADTGNHRILGWLNAASFNSGAAADLEIGQPDFTSGRCNNGTGVGDVNGIGPDSLCLFYTVPFLPTSGLTGLAVDQANNLFVADSGNSRVMEYDSPFDSCGSFPCVAAPANRVLGQTDFTSGACNHGVFAPSASSLCGPFGVALDDNGNLFVSDPGNYRVLEYNTPLNPNSGEPGAGDSVADRDFGNNSFTDRGACNSNICGPAGIAVDHNGNLYVVASGDNIVFEYNAPLDPNSLEPGAGDTLIDNFLGLATKCASGNMVPDASSFCVAVSAAVDGLDNVYVADMANSRVLKFNTPADPFSGEPGAGDRTADFVIGQSDFSGGSCNQGAIDGDQYTTVPGAASLCSPEGVGTDAGGNVYIGDTRNNRAIKYLSPFAAQGPGSGDATGDRVLGQPDFTRNTINLLDAFSLNFPQATVVDSSGHLYVNDSNGRILGWRSVADSVDGQPADLVLAQPGFTTSFCTGLDHLSCLQRGLAVDQAGNLYVTDPWRVLVYKSPFSACSAFPCVGPTAQVLIGPADPSQSSAVCESKRVSASNTCGLSSVAVDKAGNLYVSDFGDDRVLEYDQPLARRRSRAGDMVADRVFGQKDFKSFGCNNAPRHHIAATNPNPQTLCAPTALALDPSGNLFVVDSGNSRVLEYPQPLKHARKHAAASLVIGAADFFSAVQGCWFSIPTTNASNFCYPGAMAFDRHGNLFVSDSFNNRVMEFDAPLASGAAAAQVIGQQSLEGFACNAGVLPGDFAGLGPDSLCLEGPALGGEGIFIDSTDNLYIGDSGNNRLLIYRNLP